jgi:hypothetical protein
MSKKIKNVIADVVVPESPVEDYTIKPTDHDWFFIDPKALFGEGVKAYNPTIFQMNLKTWMIFRYEANGTFHTELARVELDPDTLKAIGPVAPVRITRSSARVQTIDDARFMNHKGKGLLVHCQGAEYQNYVWTSSICIADMDRNNFQCMSLIVPRYGKNVNYAQTGNHAEVWTEKNWSYLTDYDWDMVFVYKHHPFEVIRVDRNANATVVHKLDFENPWGRGIFGGTSYAEWDNDTLISMVHSYEVTPAGQRVYDAGWMLVDKHSYKPTFISKKPVVRGWDDPANDVRKTLEPNSGWMPIVWYPTGIMVRRREVVISFGWNDCRCGIAYFDKDQITKDLVKIEC